MGFDTSAPPHAARKASKLAFEAARFRRESSGATNDVSVGGCHAFFEAGAAAAAAAGCLSCVGAPLPPLSTESSEGGGFFGCMGSTLLRIRLSSIRRSRSSVARRAAGGAVICGGGRLATAGCVVRKKRVSAWFATPNLANWQTYGRSQRLSPSCTRCLPNRDSQSSTTP